MWCSSNLTASRILALMAGAMLVVLASGCMSDPDAGDLPWNRQQSWEGTPALPNGMMQPR